MLAEQKRRAKSATSAFPFCRRAANFRRARPRRFGAEALQVFYNRLDRRPEQTLFPARANATNLGIIGRVPLASGLLTGKYKPGATFPANDVRSTFDAEKLKRDLAEVERLQKTEVPAGVPMAKWAMAWCLQDPIVSAVICGCKNPEQVKANASAAELVAE